MVLVNRGETRFISNDGSADLILDLHLAQNSGPRKLIIINFGSHCQHEICTCLNIVTVSYPYKVVATDYKSFTIKYSCFEIGPFRAGNVSIENSYLTE